MILIVNRFPFRFCRISYTRKYVYLNVFILPLPLQKLKMEVKGQKESSSAIRFSKTRVRREITKPLSFDTFLGITFDDPPWFYGELIVRNPAPSLLDVSVFVCSRCPPTHVRQLERARTHTAKHHKVKTKIFSPHSQSVPTYGSSQT